MIRIGDTFYDERNGRYVTVYSQGRNPKPKCWLCMIEEMNNDGEYELSGIKLFTKNELKKFERKGGTKI